MTLYKSFQRKRLFWDTATQSTAVNFVVLDFDWSVKVVKVMSWLAVLWIVLSVRRWPAFPLNGLIDILHSHGKLYHYLMFSQTLLMPKQDICQSKVLLLHFKKLCSVKCVVIRTERWIRQCFKAVLSSAHFITLLYWFICCCLQCQNTLISLVSMLNL